jgi:hypothetical protein
LTTISRFTDHFFLGRGPWRVWAYGVSCPNLSRAVKVKINQKVVLLFNTEREKEAQTALRREHYLEKSEMHDAF